MRSTMCTMYMYIVSEKDQNSQRGLAAYHCTNHTDKIDHKRLAIAVRGEHELTFIMYWRLSTVKMYLLCKRYEPPVCKCTTYIGCALSLVCALVYYAVQHHTKLAYNVVFGAGTFNYSFESIICALCTYIPTIFNTKYT